MKTLIINRHLYILGVFLLGMAFFLMSIFGYNHFQILNIVGFLFLIIIPGLLTVTALNRLKVLEFWGRFSLIIAFSILELILVALIGNTLLPKFGIQRPLDQAYLLVYVYLLVAFLAGLNWLLNRQLEIKIHKYFFYDSLKDTFFALSPSLFVVMSVFGAIRLNNGASNILTMIMLGSMSVYLIFLLIYIKKFGENTIPTALFFMAVSFLLMTSLRGWYVTGHDIQTEYKVFQLTKTAGLWNIAFYRDAYNACLSITILPTIFSNLFSIPDPYIYKTYFQIIFALSAPIIYIVGKQWTNRTIALLSVIYFIAFPTFFTDMPFLNRQEIAFIFFGLMLYVIFNENLSIALRRWLFMIMGLGVILSHYSTTYTILMIFALVVVARPIFAKFINKFQSWKIFKNSSLLTSNIDEIPKKAKITLTMVIILLALSFLWTQTITDTSSSAVGVFSQTLAAVKEGFAGNNRSIDVSTLFSFSKPNQSQEFEDYVTTQIDPIRNTASPGEYYSEQTYDQYPIVALGPENIPLTRLGQFFQNHGINASVLLFDFGELLAKLTELFVPVGMIYLLLNNNIINYVDEELYLIAVFCLFFIFLNIVLPVLSTEYGIFRAMQQSLFIIGPVIVVASMSVGSWLEKLLKNFMSFFRDNKTNDNLFKNNKNGEIFACILGVIFLAYSTYFLPYLVGNSYAVLHLSNTGAYYDNYLIQDSEVYGVDWLTNIANANYSAVNGVRIDVQTDRYSKAKFASLTSLPAFNNIYPGVVRKDAYVFLNPATAIKHRATLIDNADNVTYGYPIQFLQDNKNLVYNNNNSEVYR